MEPSALHRLESADIFQVLVPLLDRRDAPRLEGKLETHLLQCLFYLCRLSGRRQEAAALAGLVPHLQRCVVEEHKLKQFAMQIMCDLAHTSATVRRVLWDCDGVAFYIAILDEGYVWRRRCCCCCCCC